MTYDYIEKNDKLQISMFCFLGYKCFAKAHNKC